MSVRDIINSKQGILPAATNQYFDNAAFTLSERLPTQATADSIPGVFLQSGSVKIAPLLKGSFQFEWMTGVLLLLLFVMAVLWFTAPGRLTGIYRVKHSFVRTGEGTFQGSGFLVSLLFYLNYLLVVVLFTILVVGQFFGEAVAAVSSARLMVLIALAFVAYSLYKLAFIAVAGFLFKTQTTAFRQIRLFIGLDNLTGFLLLPCLLLTLLTGGELFFYLVFFILLTTNAIKWFQTIVIGKSISQFRLYHLIVYLCTLEIIPLLLLIKLVQNLSG